MYIRDENHPIKKVSGFNHSTTGIRDYNTLQNEINSISGVTKHNLGQSSDGGYTIEGLSFGNLSGKVLTIVAGIHAGTEWVGCYYALNFFKGLVDPSIYPNQQKYLEMIVSNYDGVYLVPCANPWGFVNGQRRNANNVDLNRDFDVSSPQRETIILKNLMNSISTELFIDAHERTGGNVGIAGVDSIRGNLDNHYIDKVYLAIRYLTHLGSDFANYHGSGNASSGEMRRWVLSNLTNSKNEGTPSYIMEPGDAGNGHINVQKRYLRGINGLFAIMLAHHLPLMESSVLIKNNGQFNEFNMNKI